MSDILPISKERFAEILMVDMFQVKPGESVAITADKDSHHDIVSAMAEAAQKAGGKPFVVRVPKAEYDGQAGMKVWAEQPLTAMLSNVDIWIDAQSIVMLYSDIWENAMNVNKKLRYLVIGDTDLDSLIRTFAYFEIPTLSALLNKVMAMAKACKKVHITSKNGTDVSYDIEPKFAFDIDDGDFSKPVFGTAPGYVNIVPKLGSMNGTIVFDDLVVSTVRQTSPITFIMESGVITEINGDKEANEIRETLAAFDDPNMYKISHNMIGLNPGVRHLTGNLVEDERIWGGVDFGFGHTSPMDMPPLGQVAKSHFDGIVIDATIYFDDQKIVDNGNVCHPDLVDFADKLISDAQNSIN